MATKKKKRIKSSDNHYERFIRELKLIAMGLDSSFSKLDRSSYVQIRQGKRNALRNVTVVYKLDLVESEFFDASGTFKLTIQDKKTKERTLVIECVFDAHFHGEAPIDKLFAERFTKSELRVIMWPYFRQFVSDTTARMAIRPVILPLEP